MRICKECGIENPKEFRVAKQLCQKCYSKWYYQQNRERLIENADNWRLNNPEKYNEARRKISRRKYHKKTPEQRKQEWLERRSKMGEVERESRRERSRKYYRENKEKSQEYHKTYKEQNPNRDKAGRAVEYAVSRGDLPRISTQQCQVCNKQAKHYHHWSYEPEHWLDVIPVCNFCHGNIHAGNIQVSHLPIYLP